jgi:integrase/recombinase XerD
MNYSFHSRWHKELVEFLSFRQAYFTSEWPAHKLRRFEAYAASHRRWTFQKVVTQWLKCDPHRHPVTRSNDLSAIRQFCLYRRRLDPQGFVPDRIEPVSAVRQYFQARILKPAEVQLLLRNIRSLRGPSLRRARLRVLFLVLYCTGLRLGEALRLQLIDVDLKRAYFRIGPSKGRVRLVPFGRDLAVELNNWLKARRSAGFVLAPHTTLFEREDGRADNCWNAAMRFNTLFRSFGFKPKRGSGRGGLRVHDLRHTFAVHRLQRWYRAGLDPAPLLPWLSAYMGHVNLLGTQRYLRATPETLAVASRRMRHSLGFNPGTP